MTPHRQMQILSGIGVSDGVAVGRAVCIANRAGEIIRIPLAESEVEAEIGRLHAACARTRGEIQATRVDTGRAFGEELAAIFDAHDLLLSDATFLGGIERRIREDRVNAEWAVHETATELGDRFATIDNEYLRERGADLQDVGRQLLRTLQGIAQHEISDLEGDVVVVADDLVPSEAIRLGRANVIGFAVESGGRTSHTSIIARSLDLPAVAGVEGVSRRVLDDDPIIVDGREGVVILHPTPEVLAKYIELARELERERAAQDTPTVHLPAVTRDGVAIHLAANIDLPEELDELRRVGAKGVGLYRSEFLYMETDPRLPSEDDHLAIYRRLVAGAAPSPAIVRTYDLGGRKLAREMMESDEDNPVLGLRGIRLTLARPRIFRTQMRALLRAAADGELWIMAPMVSRVEEVRALRALVAEVATELAGEGVRHRADPVIGIMIEVPAAALLADRLAEESDFFAIGTNDLIQYSLAVDRNNQHVADLYQPLHPAILRMLRFVVESADRAGIPVSLCGEMGADPAYLPLLMGLGLRRFSVHPRAVPELRRRVRELNACELAGLGQACCEAHSGLEVQELLNHRGERANLPSTGQRYGEL
ncbi:MAG: phosphoenolpyruvate--protein phosphotransferase [Thermoanaerobaculia bacterium]